MFGKSAVYFMTTDNHLPSNILIMVDYSCPFILFLFSDL